mmetsp:Transcript_41236/g.106691  ORF Transcript_41236/g.106691 Transcript_41236/m.106691 type:complete len:747 (-) Transcript_41236:170-2410(-)|eukprot:CAMPEP_0195068270 /NCGR_PEP_ID=MMETSP0448-20130528/13064_1 /TAXON_ID=66468 /ORGANISM="Heterocapsa triquestra, Strain CCMP 448" /LENGTH=746 /DNA_ID=CAMNT_0040099795 /DNA_START=104 /DNA_END=2344 /DNA_ORIENTATION=-
METVSGTDSPAGDGEIVQVIVSHAIKKEEVVTTVSTTSTVREVVDALALALRRPDIQKKGRLVRKLTGQTHYTSMKDTEKVGSRRKFMIIGIDDLKEGPETIPVLTRDQALQIQRQLLVGFASKEFQRKLMELEWALGKDTGQFLSERQMLALEVQRFILPMYGFDAGPKGVKDMMKAFDAPHLVLEEEIMTNGVMLNHLLRVSLPGDDAGEEAYEKIRQHITSHIEKNGGPEAALAAAKPAAALPSNKPAAVAVQSGTTPPWRVMPQGGTQRLGSLVPLRRPALGEVSVVRTSYGSGERLSTLPQLHLETGRHDGDASVVIEPSVRYQTFLGFGGSFTEASCDLLMQMTQETQERIVDACFDSEKGLNYKMGRVHINSCDFSTGNWTCGGPKDDKVLATMSLKRYERSILPFLRRAGRLAGDLKLIASPWSPPAWMKDNESMLDGGKLRAECRDVWARYYVRFAELMQDAGLPLWGLTVQNEPMAVTAWENCVYTAVEERDFVRDHLGPTLEDSGMDLKLLVWDHNRDEMFARAKTIYADPRAAKYVWGVAFHWYGDPRYETWPDKVGQLCYENVQRVHELRPDKHLVMTEACQEGGPHTGEWCLGERYAENIIKDLTHWTEAWIDWNLVLNGQGGPNHVGNNCSAPILVDVERDLVLFQSSFYYIGHFSRHIQPGAKRILCSSSRDALESVAFANPDGTLAVIVLNQSEHSINMSLEYAGKAALTNCPKHSITTFVLLGNEPPQ